MSESGKFPQRTRPIFLLLRALRCPVLLYFNLEHTVWVLFGFIVVTGQIFLHHPSQFYFVCVDPIFLLRELAEVGSIIFYFVVFVSPSQVPDRILFRAVATSQFFLVPESK